MDQNNGESTASEEIMYNAVTGEQVFYDADNTLESIPIITEEEIDNSRVVRRRLRSSLSTGVLSTGVSPSNESLGPMTESEVVALYNESNERPIQGSSTNNPIPVGMGLRAQIDNVQADINAANVTMEARRTGMLAPWLDGAELNAELGRVGYSSVVDVGNSTFTRTEGGYTSTYVNTPQGNILTHVEAAPITEEEVLPEEDGDSGENVDADSVIENSTSEATTLGIENEDFLNSIVEESMNDAVLRTINGTLIPENSSILNVESDTIRFSSAVWFEKVKTMTITVAGLGGIGSYVTFLLARLKPAALIVYDHDVVDETNMSGQLYSISDCGKNKGIAIANICRLFANYSTIFKYNMFMQDSEIKPVAICGFDNMEARKTFFNAWSALIIPLTTEERAKCLYIDGRLAAEELQVYCFTGNDADSISKYMNNCLFTDAEADETVCSYKQTSFMANMIGSLITNLFVNFVTNLCDPIMYRDLPFLTSYDASIMFFKTEN